MNYKYILFDLDGTITDSEEGITKSVVYALEQEGIHAGSKESYRSFIGPPLEESFAAMGMNQEEIDRLILSYRKRFDAKGWMENTPYKGMETLLESLQSKYILGLATSKPTVYAEKILAHYDFSKYFKVIVGSNLDRTRINKSDVIKEAMSQLNHPDPKDVLMIGDRLHDIVGARSNHIDALRVMYGFGTEDEHDNYEVIDTCTSVEALMIRLNRS